jgi:hypothetical protein
MKKGLVSLAAALTLALSAPRAEAKAVAVYASGQTGLQTHGDTSLQYGFEAGLHVFLFDGYVEYMAFGSSKSVSRAIVGVRGALGSGRFRLVLRGGVGGIRESSGALTTATGPSTLTRSGGVARGGAAVEARLFYSTYLGLAIDGEAYNFLGNNQGFSAHGSNLLGTLRLTFELGL